MSGDKQFVSGGMDGEIRFADMEKDTSALLSQSLHMALKFQFLHGSSHVFLSTHQEGMVKLFDLREKVNRERSRDVVFVRGSAGEGVATNSIAMCPMGQPTFALGCADPFVRLFDMRKLRSSDPEDYRCVEQYVPQRVLRTYHKKNNYPGFSVTGVAFNELGEIAATYSREDAYVFSTHKNDSEAPLDYPDWKPPTSSPAAVGLKIGHKHRYQGHRNVRTFLKEIAFFGNNKYVTTGSDCGNLFVWDKDTEQIVQMLDSDRNVVNGVSPHPFYPHLATCGIDSEGKVFQPWYVSTFDKDQAEHMAAHNSQYEDQDQIPLLNVWNFLAMMRERGANFLFDFDGDGSEESSSDEEEQDNREEEAPAEPSALARASVQKASGNGYYKKKQYEEAIEQYQSAVDTIDRCTLEGDEEEEPRMELRTVCILNKAACLLHTEQFEECAEVCTGVLELRPDNVKALYRRAKARKELGMYAEALEDLQRAAARDTSPLISNLIDEVKGLIVEGNSPE